MKTSKDGSKTPIILAIITLIGTLGGAYFAYRASIEPTAMEIEATQIAEFRLTESYKNESVNTPKSDIPSPTDTPEPSMVQIIADADTYQYICLSENCEKFGENSTFLTSIYCYDDVCSTFKGLIHFNLSEIPKGSTIISAEINLYIEESEDDTVSLFITRSLSSWSEDDYQNYPLECDPLNTYKIASVNVGWNSVDITPIIKYQFSNQMENYGMCVFMEDDSPKSSDLPYITISSSENSSSQKPKLNVFYYPKY